MWQLPVGGERAAEVNVEVFQVFESDGSFDVDKEYPQGDSG